MRLEGWLPSDRRIPEVCTAASGSSQLCEILVGCKVRPSMPASTPANSWRHRPFLFDNQRLLFSLSSYLACVITLGVAFEASMPRPWWALLTVYVTAQPMSGALRPKVSYRLIGIVLGAAVAVLLVPNLQNSPEILVPALAAWTGFSIHLAIHDRTPRAFLFQMSAFSARMTPAVCFRAGSKGAITMRVNFERQLNTEPPRDYRRQFGLSYAAMAGCSSMA